jgi:hypothetical protein
MTTPTIPPQAEIIQLGIGDTVPIGNILLNMFLMGLVTDPNNPNMFAATMQAYQRQALLTVPVLQGVQGVPGEPSFALQWQNDDKIDPSQLPTDLGDTAADKGKFWVFGVTDELGNTVATTMYVWWGTVIGWRQLPVGAPGPPGPYPLITPHIVLEPQGSGHGPEGQDSWIHVDGIASNPQFTFHIAAPQGLPGPSAALGSCPDIDFTTRAPQAGDTLVCTARKTPGAPTGLTITPLGTGGTLPAGTYFYKVTATMTNGETLGGNEVTTGALTGATNSVILNWTAPANGGATGYKIYRGTVIGQENKLVGVVTDGATVTFLDDGSSSTPATIPSTGVVAGRNIWVPQPPLQMFPLIYTMPEAAFTSASGIGGTSFAIGSFAVPKAAWAWKPYVFGQLLCFGLNISFTPLLIGAEIRLGNPTTGQIVARGFSNNLGYVTFIPHTSDPANPSTAMTPTNGVGLVVANHVGNAGTLYINLINQGMAGTFNFDASNAALSVLQMPVPQ